MKVNSVLYFHGSKEEAIEVFERECENNNFSPPESAFSNAAYGMYEIAIEVEWDLKTGDCRYLGLKS